MRFFPDNIENEMQARLNYKRLAVLYHPDRGGNEEIMREINREYDIVKRKLKKYREGLRNLKPGDSVIVNGTECEVTAVFDKTFIARAKGRHRLAIFDKKTGYSVYDKKYKAHLPEK
jgi:curved DNA-binding protein CbpA